MNRQIRLLWHYKQISFAVLAALLAGVLTAIKLSPLAHFVLALVSLIAVIPLVTGMWQDFRSGQYGLDVLALTAIIASVALRQDWAAIIVVIMLTGGESLEQYAQHRARSELDSLLAKAPQHAHLIKASRTVDVTVDSVRGGDTLLIKSGEVVPVDAVILDGQASFDESSLTGESIPQLKKRNDQLVSGSVNLDGAVTVRALHSAHDSQYEQIIRLVRAAQASQAPFVRIADRFSIPFSIAAYAIAISVWVLSGHAIRFLEVIIVATPCPLLLAAPIAFISGMSRASKSGIIIKTASSLERLAAIRTMAFDKTGTLTIGQPKVADITTYRGHTKDEVLALAASLEQNSNHILAIAVVEAAEHRNLKIVKAKHIQETAGHGLRAQQKGNEILVGQPDFLQQHNVAMPSTFKAGTIRQTAACVAIDGNLAGVITFHDELRPEAKATLQSLSALGVEHTLMLTGDNQAAAKSIARQVGIEQFQAGALPGDKLRAIEKISDRPVGFVGDGVNDAPVLTAADVGIALGARGSTAASESADVVIMPDDLSYVSQAMAIARHSLGIAKQSIVVGIGLSLALMLAFATGKFPPVLGAVLQEVVDVVVICNALRAHHFQGITD